MRLTSHQNFRIGFYIIVIAFFGIAVDVEAISTARIGRVQNLEIIGGQVTAVTLQWKRVAHATSYHVRVLQQNDDTETFDQVRVIKKITGRTTAVENLDANTTYGFQVRAVRKKQHGRWSKRIEITTP